MFKELAKIISIVFKGIVNSFESAFKQGRDIYDTDLMFNDTKNLFKIKEDSTESNVDKMFKDMTDLDKVEEKECFYIEDIIEHKPIDSKDVVVKVLPSAKVAKRYIGRKGTALSLKGDMIGLKIYDRVSLLWVNIKDTEVIGE